MPTECLQIWAWACGDKHQEATKAQQRLNVLSQSVSFQHVVINIFCVCCKCFENTFMYFVEKLA